MTTTPTTQREADELLPCPFCGGAPKLEETRDTGPGIWFQPKPWPATSRACCIHCCHARVYKSWDLVKGDEDDARTRAFRLASDDWNRRAAIDQSTRQAAPEAPVTEDHDWMGKIPHRFGNPAAATDQPSAGLTDERIDAIARDHNLDGSMLNKPRHAYWRMFAHAIEREARASLTPTAPAPQRPSDDDLWDQTLRDRDTYHDWADKLADAIAKHFGADIGEHSNMNCPWAEALEVIECATPTAPQAASQQGEAGPASEQVMIELMRKALEDIAQPADVGCGCSFPCRCNDDGAEAVNARAMRGIASDTLSEVERLCRAQRLASQRARIKARFANRPRTPATADFDLPAPNDVVCDHAWPEADGQADINGHCEMCGLTFQRYIHGDNFNEGAPQAATTASTSGDCSTCNGNREREVSEFKTVPCPDCAQAPSQPASASGEPSSIWRIRHPDGCTTYQDTEPADYLRPYATAYRAQAPSREAARLPTLPGCLADRLYEAISIARNRAEHAGSTPRIAKWDATAADLRAALARAPLPAQEAGQSSQVDPSQALPHRTLEQHRALDIKTPRDA